MTEALRLCFDERLASDESNQPAQQLDAHLVTLAGVAGTLAAALLALKEESLAECAYFLELDIQRVRELLADCDLSPGLKNRNAIVPVTPSEDKEAKSRAV